jgi:hypothetical protein
MGFGPIIASTGFLLMTRLGTHVDYWAQLFVPIVLFGIGLAITVAPLTSAILGDVPKDKAGIASAVNNAVARIAGLVAVAAVGAIVAAQFSNVVDQKMKTAGIPPSTVTTAKQVTLQTTPPEPYKNNPQFKQALSDASVSAFHAGVFTIAALLIAGGVVSLIGIRNPIKN